MKSKTRWAACAARHSCWDASSSSNELREYTDVIISEADRLAALVDTLLGPGGPPNKRPVNVHELLEYVMRLLEPELGERLSVTRLYDPGLPLIDLDRDQIVQALMNLVRNAMTALEGRATWSCAPRRNELYDRRTGTRLSRASKSRTTARAFPDLQDSVFYPAGHQPPDGTGLGLPAAQELISRHGGLIEFESRPGRTVFSCASR